MRAERYYERVNRQEPLNRITIRRLEHIYYKKDTLNNKIEANLATKLGMTAEDVRQALSAGTLVHSASRACLRAHRHVVCPFGGAAFTVVVARAQAGGVVVQERTGPHPDARTAVSRVPPRPA